MKKFVALLLIMACVSCSTSRRIPATPVASPDAGQMALDLLDLQLQKFLVDRELSVYERERWESIDSYVRRIELTTEDFELDNAIALKTDSLKKINHQ